LTAVGTHRVIAFAAPSSDAGRQALAAMKWPGLSALLARLTPLQRDDGDAFSLSPPHERVLAAALGWRCADGHASWAARQLRALGHDPGSQAWGLLTPAHWHLGTEQLSMGDPAALLLDDATSRSLLDAIAPLFSSEGFEVRWGAAQAWFIGHASLGAVPTAALDRVIGRNVDPWLPAGAPARLLRRLQNEVQMLLYTHPLNAERERRGLLPVNSVWLSGCGVALPEAANAVVLDTRLRGPALNEDWAAWASTWALLDAELAGADIDTLTLCGERSAATFAAQPRSAWSRFASSWRRPVPLPLLESL
jgi:hypothetical protein